MTLSYRIYFVDENDSIKKMSQDKFQRLMNGDRKTSCPEYAGKKMRNVFVLLDIEDRKPLKIRRVDGGYVTFDEDGRFDKEDSLEQMSAAMSCMSIPGVTADDPNVIDAQSKFAQKTFDHKYKWEPGEYLMSEIERMIFK